MSVAHEICQWLLKQDAPRTTMEIRDAVLPGGTGRQMHNHIGPLLRVGKLRKVTPGAGRAGGATFAANPDALKDRRFRPTTAQRVVVARKSVRPQVVGDVSADVAAWMASGGRVQRLGRHETSQPFKRIGAAA